MIDEKEKENALFTPVKVFTESTSISRIDDNSEQSVDITSERSDNNDSSSSSSSIIRRERDEIEERRQQQQQQRRRKRRTSRRRSSFDFVEESIDTSSNTQATPSKTSILNVKAPQISYTPFKKKQLPILSRQQQQQQHQEQEQEQDILPVTQIQQQAKNLFFKRRRRNGTKKEASPHKKKIVTKSNLNEYDEVEIDSIGREMEQSDLVVPKSVLEETFDYYDTHCADLIKSVDISSIGAGCAFSTSDKLSLGKEEQEQELELEGESFIDPEYNI